MSTVKGAGREGRGRPDLELGEYMTPASTAPPYGTCRNQTVRWHHSKASRNTKDSCSWHPMQTAASGINKINGRRDGELIFFEPAVLPAINTPSATWSWVKHECKTALSESVCPVHTSLQRYAHPTRNQWVRVRPYSTRGIGKPIRSTGMCPLSTPAANPEKSRST